MMSSIPATPFRFRDLPSEIRNKIYRNLLCEFAPPPTVIRSPDMLDLERAGHASETAILRTNTETYREAYDVMIKTNRFVKVTSVRGISLRLLMKGQGVPVVTLNKDIVERFRGYVLNLDLSFQRPLQLPENHESEVLWQSCTLMILHRDLDRFCQALTDGDLHQPGFSEILQISITMAPLLDNMRNTRYTPSLEGFFSKKTQETLLAPLRTRLYGYKAVKVSGHIDSVLSDAVRDDLGREQWVDPKSILTEFLTAKEDGTRLFQAGKSDEACLRWQDAVAEIDKIHESSSWAKLVRRGGERFISQLAELYFLMRLNIAHIQIICMQNQQALYIEGLSAEVAINGSGLMAEYALNSAIKSLKKGFWTSENKYRPSVKHLAKLRYRFALFLRLQAKPGTANQALTHIDKALRLQPGDAAIVRERQNILAWMQQI